MQVLQKIPISTHRFLHLLQDPLFQNSFYIMISSIVSSIFGFVFWLIAAKLYSPEDVGIGTALIASITLLTLLTRMGFDFSIIRFFPEYDKNKIFSTSVMIVVASSIFFGSVFIIGTYYWAPDLAFLNSAAGIFFILFLIANSVCLIQGNAFLALRKAGYYLLQNIVLGVRIIFIVLFTFMESIGIFLSVGVSFFLAMIQSLIQLNKNGVSLNFQIDTTFLKNSFHYSFGNYLSNLFRVAPNHIYPILILNLLGSVAGANYYISFMIASLLFLIPNAVGTSLFVEGSHGKKMKEIVSKAFVEISLLLVPSIIIIIAFGDEILSLFGTSYVDGLELLKILAVSSIFYSVFTTYLSILRIEKKIGTILFLSIVELVTVLSLGFILVSSLGLEGAGLSWLITYVILTVLVVLIIAYNYIFGKYKKQEAA